MLARTSIVLTADVYVSVLPPNVTHKAAWETARPVLNAASTLERQLSV